MFDPYWGTVKILDGMGAVHRLDVVTFKTCCEQERSCSENRVVRNVQIIRDCFMYTTGELRNMYDEIRGELLAK